MLSHRKYKILKSMVKLKDKKKNEEHIRNQLIEKVGGMSTNIHHINIGIDEISKILKGKYPDKVLIYELHELGDLQYINIDQKDKNDVLYNSIEIKGEVAVSDYWKTIVFNIIGTIIIPAIVSIIVSFVVQWNTF